GAISDWRASSLAAPAQDTLGPSATDVFCRLTEAGSKIFIYFGVHPWLALLFGAIAVGIPVYVINRARPLLRVSLAIYRAHWPDFLQIGLLALPVGVAFNGLGVLLSENPPLEWLIQWMDGSAGARLLVALLMLVLQQAAMQVLVAPAVVRALADVRDGR